ncbi:hypothetical protein EMPS_09093 [Entomortierella parvispora]|uniref:Uncharacterized protein n=1 Tax=Entomortierella parvispora TaxID=205924 RepID=A0A9P3LZY0_9FUNG|nr:hypothetical protein EMPS_09093 [Entomortierella parvispora]
MPFHEEHEYPHLRSSSSSFSIHSTSSRSRRSSIDPSSCPGGVLTSVLQSAAEAKAFYDDLVLSDHSYFRELDITLDWSTTYNDLKNLRDAILRVPHIKKLRLDCKNQHGPTSDLVNRGKRANPLVQIMMQHRHLILIDFVGVDGFFSRSTTASFEPPAESSIVTMVSPYKVKKKGWAAMMLGSSINDGNAAETAAAAAVLHTHLREVHIDGNFDPVSHAERMKALLTFSPNMTALTLSCTDQDFCSTVYTVRDLVANSPAHSSVFRYLDISSPLFTAVFDRREPTSAFAKMPHRDDWIRPGSDPVLTVIERFGQDLEIILIDDSFGDEHVVALERTTRERHRLKLVEMRIGFALITNSALTEVGQKSLLTVLRRQPQPVEPEAFYRMQQQNQLQGQQGGGGQIASSQVSRLLQVPGMLTMGGGLSSTIPAATPVKMQPPTELMFAIANDRLDWFLFLGALLDRTSAIRVQFHNMNKWIPLLDKTIELPDPTSKYQQLLQQQILPHDPNTVNSLNSGMINMNLVSDFSQVNTENILLQQLRKQQQQQQQQDAAQTSNLQNSILPPSPVQTYPIRALEIEGTGSELNPGTISSLLRLLYLSPHVEILILSSFKIETEAGWEATLAAISVTDLKELSFAGTNVPLPLLVGDGGERISLLERLQECPSLKILNLSKTDMNRQEVEAIKQRVQLHLPGCKLFT